MSLTAAMNSAVSGLGAVTRATELVANNIANAATPGYGRRTLALSSYGGGLSGVRVMGVVRQSDPILASQRRDADAQLAQADVRTSFFQAVSREIGAPGDIYGLQARLADFDASLITAASRPDLPERLDDAVLQAVELASHISESATGIQARRQQADQAIAGLVSDLNAGLEQLQQINAQMTGTLSAGADTSGLQDQRQQVLDQINAIVPVTVVERQYGQIALYSEGGAILLDGPAAEIGFTPATTVGPQMTVENGGLNGLTLNGIEIRTDSAGGALRGGALGAQFAVRDEWATEAQAGLDTIAQDLIARFEDPALDPTRAAGQPGLFTDGGSALDPTDTIGLAQRLTINADVDPAQGGESWRLRDGVGAAAPGNVGNAGLLNAMNDALTAPRTPPNSNLGAGPHSALSLSTGLVSQLQHQLATAQNAQSYASASQTELTQLELAQGVDTDAELQSLILLEQNYAANARVLETIDTLFTELLRI